MLIEAALQTGVGCFECLKHDKHVNKVFLKYYYGLVMEMVLIHLRFNNVLLLFITTDFYSISKSAFNFLLASLGIIFKMRIKETSDLKVKKKKKRLVGLNIKVTSCVVILDLFN